METIDFRISNDKENFVECKKKKATKLKLSCQREIKCIMKKIFSQHFLAQIFFGNVDFQINELLFTEFSECCIHDPLIHTS